jgi:hypothetical protein
MGTSVNAIIRLAIREKAIVRPISVKICFVRPFVNTIGRNTATVVSVEDVIAPAT